MIDLIVIMIILFGFLWGLNKGLGRISLDFLVLTLGAGIGWYYYNISGGLADSLLIFLIISFFLTLLKWLIIKAFPRQPRQPRQKSHPYSSNHILGANIGLVSGILIVAFLFILIEVVPIYLESWINFKQRVDSSKSYGLVKKLIPLNKIRVLKNLMNISSILNNPRLVVRLINQREFKSLLKNKDFKAIVRHPKIIKQLKIMDYYGLLKNPQILALLNNPEIIQQISDIDYEKILKVRD